MDLMREAEVTAAWREFALRKYTLVEGLIPPLHLKSLQEYFQSLMDFGWVRLGDPDSPLRYNAHNDELVFFFQDQAASLAGRIVGRPVKASHNHLISYLPGATLRQHVDQAEHRYGLSLLLDFRGQSDHSQPGKSWPLVLHAESGKEGIEIPQEIGEAVFYDACEVPHSRRGALPEGQVSSSLLLHFVAQEDRGPKEYSPFYY
ncbi:MAG TPA: hypothetical protein VFX30_09455 [bacterium]|nr:hypothetical protein [bacterium]